MRLARPKLLLLLTGVALGSCATGGSGVRVTAEATGSAFFSLGRPEVYRVGDAVELAGRVCRRARGTLLSPPRVRLEHVGAGGEVLDTAHARVPEIHRNADQACRDYATRVSWSITGGETVRACFDRGRACPLNAAVKAVVTAPAAPPGPP